jgi:lysophospholipid acyltransferase (LPLAT)-like uncharacterized protein
MTTIEGESKTSGNTSSVGLPLWRRFLAGCIRFLVFLWLKTLRYRVEGVAFLEEAREAKARVYLFWHGEQFLLLGWNPEARLCALTSQSQDGRLQARVLEELGLQTVAGSSSRGGAAGLRGMLRALRQGSSLALAADGPRGPLHRVKPGAIWLASRGEAPLLPLRARAAHAWVLRRAWDHFLLPFPFTQVTIFVGEPFSLTTPLSPQACAELQEQLREHLEELGGEEH